MTNHLMKLKLKEFKKYEHLPQQDPDSFHPCVHRPNDFRYNCLYRLRVSKVLTANNKFLQAVFAFYSTHGGRKNELRIDRWFDLIRDTNIIDQDSSERDILLCFCYSRMRVRDEMHDRHRVTVLTYCDFLESLVRIAMVKALDLYALILQNRVEMGELPGEPPLKWLEAGFRPECKAVDRLAAKGTMKWRAEDAGDRLDILIRGIKYMFETKMDWHLNSQFSRLTSKQVRVLESRDIKGAKKAPQTTVLQRFEPETGHCLFNQTAETGYVNGITVSNQTVKALVNVFGNTRAQHNTAMSGGSVKSKLLGNLKKKKKKK